MPGKESIKSASNSLFKLFQDNVLKGIVNKCDLLVNTSSNVSIRLGNLCKQ